MPASAAPPWLVPPVRSEAARRVAEWFGLPIRAPDDAPRALPAAPRPARDARAELDPCAGLSLPPPGQILLITGPSGSGKSTLLRALRDSARAGEAQPKPLVLDIARARLRRLPCVNQFGRADGRRLNNALDLLSRVGLGEAFTYLRLPGELSDGQRWRLRLAVCLGQARRARGRAVVLVADEFCAVLDRISAAVVARGLRRMIDRPCAQGPAVSAIVATSHDDLEPALLPDVTARCDFGRTTLVCAQACEPDATKRNCQPRANGSRSASREPLARG